MQGVDFNINANVAIRHVNKDTGKIEEFYGHNLATKTMTLGIFKFLRGDFAKADTEDSMDDFYPYYLICGASDEPVLFNDTSLKIPLYKDGSKDDTPYPYSVGTIIYKKGIGSTSYGENSNTITLQLRFYIPTNALDGTTENPTQIKEVGLATRNLQLCARFVIPNGGIEKADNDFVDVLWEIAITSVVS